MKICHITSAHSYTDARILEKECVSLAKNKDNEVFLISPGAQEGVYKRVRILNVKKANRRLERFTKTIHNIYKKAIEVDADVYHFHDPDLMIIVNKLLKNGKKVIYDVHEDYPRRILIKKWLPNLFKPVFSKITEMMEVRVSKKIHGIVGATDYISDRFKNYNGNVCTLFNYPINHVNELKQNNKQYTFCYVGSISNTRGLTIMLDILVETKQKLLLVGKFAYPSEYEEIQCHPGWDYVDYKGVIPFSEVENEISKAKIGFVLLKKKENHEFGLPIKLFEYMKEGLPVIGSHYTPMKEIIETYNCGKTVDPDNKEEIYKTVKEMLNDKEIIQMGYNGKKAVEHNLNWNSQEPKLFELYRGL